MVYLHISPLIIFVSNAVHTISENSLIGLSYLLTSFIGVEIIVLKEFSFIQFPESKKEIRTVVKLVDKPCIWQNTNGCASRQSLSFIIA